MSEPRICYCEVSGVAIPYSGRGRPPKFSPEVKAERMKEQRRAASARQREKKKFDRDHARALAAASAAKTRQTAASAA